MARLIVCKDMIFGGGNPEGRGKAHYAPCFI
jgi:hypothetical protein